MSPKNNSGFTILELIVNVAIIGILAAIAVPAYISFIDKARVAQAKSDLHNIQLAIEQLANDTNKWPGPNDVGKTADQEVWDLNDEEAGLVKTNGAFPNWKGPYMQSVPKDPWGMNYFFDPDYKIGGTDYAVIGSFGPNKCCQNTYDSDNVYLILPTQ
ncbi:prepilin-type N-terminal cleavage/methylation domain-containing protein [bacterium]|nr:MAG: prepilin-type N-terminal cleavage/methylation domain-containing protein [bacterium]